MSGAFYALLLIGLLVAGLAWLAYRQGKLTEHNDIQAKVAHSLWEEAEHDKHLDSITPSTPSELFERMRRNNKG